jgi:hypothetical protein
MLAAGGPGRTFWACAPPDERRGPRMPVRATWWGWAWGEPSWL